MMDQDYYSDEEFINLNLNSADLSQKEFEDCIFKQCKMSESKYINTRFENCEFEDCDLSNINIAAAKLQEVHFIHCKMLGIAFNECNPILFQVDFFKCQLDYSSFYQCKLNKMSFESSSLIEVDFSEAQMQSANIRDCNLERSIFDRTDLRKTDFRGSIALNITPENNQIQKARFNLEQAPGLLSQYQLHFE